jgi:MFS family permease
MAAFLLFNAVEYATWVAVLLYAYEATGPASVGIVSLVQLLPSAVFAATAAAVADRYRRDRVLVTGYVVQAAAMGATATAMLAGAPPVLVYLLATVASCSLTLTRPTQGALLPAIARTPEELTAANGLAGSVEGLGTTLGPLAAAAILVVASPGAVFVAAALAGLLAAALVMRLPSPGGWAAFAPGWAHDHHPSDHGQAADDDLGSLAAETGRRRIVRGLRALTANPDAGLVVGLMSARMLVIGALDVLYVLLALQVLGTGEPGAGMLNAAMGLGTVAGGAATFALAGRRRLAPVLAGGAVVVGVALVLMGGTADPLVAATLLAFAGAGLAIVDVAGRTMLQRVAQDRVLARLLGALEGIGMAALAAGSVLVPVLAGVWDIRVAVVVAGLLLPLSVGITWFRLRSLDGRSRVPERELAFLRANTILAPLPAPQLESVARHATWLAVEDGESLIREGEAGDRYFVLASGSVRVTKGSQLLRRLATPGDGFGEIALLRDVPRTASVTASAPVVVLAIDRADFLQAVTGHEHAQAIRTHVAADRSEPGYGGVIPD